MCCAATGWQRGGFGRSGKPQQVRRSIQLEYELTTHSASKVVDFGRELAGVSFMNGATLAGWTKDGGFNQSQFGQTS